MATKVYSNVDKPIQLVELFKDNGDGTGSAVASASALPVAQVTSYYGGPYTITRPANQTPYTAGDVVGGAITLAALGPAAGGGVLILSDSLELDIAAIPAGMTSFRLHLYNVTPPSAIADNAAWDLPSGDRASYIGYMDLGTPVDVGSTCYVRTDIANTMIKLAGASGFAYLVTNAGYTPAANSEVYVVTLHAAAI